MGLRRALTELGVDPFIERAVQPLAHVFDLPVNSLEIRNTSLQRTSSGTLPPAIPFGPFAEHKKLTALSGTPTRCFLRGECAEPSSTRPTPKREISSTGAFV